MPRSINSLSNQIYREWVEDKSSRLQRQSCIAIFAAVLKSGVPGLCGLKPALTWDWRDAPPISAEPLPETDINLELEI